MKKNKFFPIFRYTEVNIGRILPNSEATLIEFPFTGDMSLIERVQPGCGCIVDDIIINNVLQLKYNEEDTKKLTLEIAKKYFSNKIFPIHKSLDVYYKDNISLFRRNKDGVNVFNKSKAHTTLTFKGEVDISYLWNN